MLASTTNTPIDNALIILFLCGKCIFSGLVPIGYSEIIQPPDFIIFLANSILSFGYILSIPLPRTAIVRPILKLFNNTFSLFTFCIAPICAHVSIPIAKPLIILIPCLLNSLEILYAVFLPY